MTWFEQVREFLLNEDRRISKQRCSLEFDALLNYGIDQELMGNMARKYFYPWQKQPLYVNKLYFVSCGGLKIVMDVYAALLRHPWNDSLTKLKYVQFEVLNILWNLAETFELRRLIVSHNGLQLCIQSLLQEKVVAGVLIEAEDTTENLLVEMLQGALGVLCK